jgi:hypothetical protein
MKDNKLLKYSEIIFSGLFFAGIFIFFTFFYNYHLHFQEGTQFFLWTCDYFSGKINLPGGFAGWLGEFLAQFYYLSFAGPLIITLLLFLVQRATLSLLKSVNVNRSYFPLSFLPALNGAMILCDEFYPLSAITGILIALFTAFIYISIKPAGRRSLAGILIIPLTYFLAGGSFFSTLAIVIVYEFIISLKAGKKKSQNVNGKNSLPEPVKWWMLIIYIIVGFVVPYLVRQFLIQEPAGLAYFSEFYYDLRTQLPVAIPVLFALAPLLMLLVSIFPSANKTYKVSLVIQMLLFGPAVIFGFKLWANFGAESIMKYDYLARMHRWNDVIKYAEKKPPRNNLSLSMLNLSLAKTGTMGDKMFHFSQNGLGGLFLPFEKEYVAPMMGSEIFYQLGLINAAQEYSFESTETTPGLNKTVRSIKRLAETNLINGNYDVSRKYLRLLEKTIFYRKWALRAEKYLYNDEMINKDPDWGEKRKMMIKTDFFFKIEIIEGTLKMLLQEDPMNNMAYQYLMAFYLINKDLGNFMHNVPKMNDLKYTRIPLAYQEAIMYVIGLTTDNPMGNIPYQIGNETRMKMQQYASIYTTRENPKALLQEKFSDTYWYYFHFVKINTKDDKK